VLDLHLMDVGMWVSHPLQVSQLGQLSLSSFHPFEIDKVSSKLQSDIRFGGAIW